MPIEFRCPECSALVRTPDSAAGKKGKCPTCSAVVQIPSGSDDAEKPAATITADGKLEFSCTSCSKPVRVPASSAGKKGRCPHCQTIVEIPTPATKSDAAPKRPASKPAGGPIEFNCPLCSKLVKTPAAAAGKKGKCPHCQGVVDIPKQSTAAKSAPAAAKGPIEFPCPNCGNQVKTPASAAGKKGKCPKCQSVVDIPAKSAKAAPSSGGLTPLPGPSAAEDPFGGLTPLDEDPLGGLTPLGDDPLGGLTPIGGDSLGGLAPLGDPLGGGPLGDFGAPLQSAPMPSFGVPANANPYAAPAAVARPKAKKSSGPRTGSQTATMVCGIILCVYHGFQIGWVLVGIVMNGVQFLVSPPALEGTPFGEGMSGAESVGFTVGIIIGIALVIILPGLGLAGGVMMARFRMWGLALTGAIVTFIPCTCFGCILGPPLSIWAIVMLSLQDVRKAFK